MSWVCTPEERLKFCELRRKDLEVALKDAENIVSLLKGYLATADEIIKAMRKANGETDPEILKSAVKPNLSAKRLTEVEIYSIGERWKMDPNMHAVARDMGYTRDTVRLALQKLGLVAGRSQKKKKKADITVALRLVGEEVVTEES